MSDAQYLHVIGPVTPFCYLPVPAAQEVLVLLDFLYARTENNQRREQIVDLSERLALLIKEANARVAKLPVIPGSPSDGIDSSYVITTNTEVLK